MRIDADLKQLADFHQNWAMTVAGFQSVPVVIFYVIAMALLCSHLSHGVASIFQTLGLRSRKTAGAIQTFSKAFAVILFLGFISIPVSICFFGLGQKEMNDTIKNVKAAAALNLSELPGSHSSH